MLVFMTHAGIYNTRWYLCYMLACRCWYKVSIYALVLVHGLYLERLHHGELLEDAIVEAVVQELRTEELL